MEQIANQVPPFARYVHMVARLKWQPSGPRRYPLGRDPGEPSTRSVITAIMADGNPHTASEIRALHPEYNRSTIKADLRRGATVGLFERDGKGAYWMRDP